MTSFLTLVHARVLNAYASLRDREEGQGLTEYIVLVSAIAVMVFAIVGALTGVLQTYLTGLINNMPTS
jgi:Flp pilus assembly pilin Flp